MALVPTSFIELLSDNYQVEASHAGDVFLRTKTTIPLRGAVRDTMNHGGIQTTVTLSSTITFSFLKSEILKSGTSRIKEGKMPQQIAKLIAQRV